MDDVEISDNVKVGERTGKVISIEDVAGGKRKYEVLFEEEAQIRSYISPPTDIVKVHSPLEQAENLDFDSWKKFDLLTEANRLSLAYRYDHLLSLSNSRINLEYYQVEAVYRVINGFKPRFLIADDVGLGKTIETGMIYKELMARGLADRVLIVTPAYLATQWRREMREKFDENFWVYNSDIFNQLADSLPKDKNPWEHRDKVITSVDYAKQEYVRASLKRPEWDIIVFDEAHKLSVGTQRYKLAKVVQDRTDGLLLLTATPHKGKKKHFYHLISLIDPFLFESEKHINPERLNDVMIRRGKGELKDENGEPIFTKRNIEVIPISFTDEEIELYQEVTRYTKEQYNISKKQKKRAVGFVMVLFQKRMVSSINAIKKSLRRRAKKIKLKQSLVEEVNSLLEEYEHHPEELTAQERSKVEDAIEGEVLDEDPVAIEEERQVLLKLSKKAENLKQDSKAQALLNFLDRLFSYDPDEKILIFTEYKDTLFYLEDLIEDSFPDKELTKIYGDMDTDHKEGAEEDFREQSNILLATDAAGEGINLQFCHIMINYELPWNPNRIDQRIGRLHRYGQERDVKVFNLQVENTVEGKVFMRLQQKLDKIEQDLGELKSDILGTLLEGVDLKDRVMSAVAGNEDPGVTIEDIEQAMEDRKEMLDRVNSDLLMNLKDFDLSAAREIVEDSKEEEITNENVERFVRLFFELHNGQIENTRYNNVYRIKPPNLLLGNDEIKEKYENACFQKEVAEREDIKDLEFIAFGHPLLSGTINYLKGRSTQEGKVTIKGVKNTKYSGRSGVLFNFVHRIENSIGEVVNEQLLSFFVNKNEQVNQEAPNYLLNGKEHEKIIPTEKASTLYDEEVLDLSSNIDRLKQVATDKARELAENRREEIEEETKREVEVRLNDANKYYEFRKGRIEQRLGEYKERLEEGEDYAVAIRGEESKLERLKNKYEKRVEELEKEKEIIGEDPELLNMTFVVFD